MEKEKLICPICGKEHATAVNLANCILEDEKKNAELQAKKEAIEKEKRAKALEEEIAISYKELSDLVEEYNEISKNKYYYITLKEAQKYSHTTVPKKKNKKTDEDYINENIEKLWKAILG